MGLSSLVELEWLLLRSEFSTRLFLKSLNFGLIKDEKDKIVIILQSVLILVQISVLNLVHA